MQDIRNIAIIAHGKNDFGGQDDVAGHLFQTTRQMVNWYWIINDLERERGITILSKKRFN